MEDEPIQAKTKYSQRQPPGRQRDARLHPGRRSVSSARWFGFFHQLRRRAPHSPLQCSVTSCCVISMYFVLRHVNFSDICISHINMRIDRFWVMTRGCGTKIITILKQPMTSGEVPTRWRQSFVTAILKSSLIVSLATIDLLTLPWFFDAPSGESLKRT